MTEEKACPPTDSEGLREALGDIASACEDKDLRYFGRSRPDVALKIIDYIHGAARAALGEARGTASASEPLDAREREVMESWRAYFVELSEILFPGAPLIGWKHIIDRARTLTNATASASESLDKTPLTAAEIAQARKEESERWRARYGDSEDALHKALTLLRWIADNEEEAFDINREAWRDEWPAKDTRARLLDEWDKKMVEAKTLAARLGEAPGDAPTAPPAPDLLRENARLREELREAKAHHKAFSEEMAVLGPAWRCEIAELRVELTRARAAHLENAELLAKARGRVTQLETAIQWAQGEIDAPGVGWFGTQEDAAGPRRRPYWWRGPLRKLAGPIPSSVAPAAPLNPGPAAPAKEGE